MEFPSWLRELDDREVACKFCGERIRWGRTTKGKRIPIDVKTLPEVIAHFTTCPHADKARRRP